MRRIWRVLRGYILWNYQRGSVHYDIMVVVILAFVFLSPRWISYRDKPTERVPHPTEVVVIPDGNSGFIYEVEAGAVSQAGESDIRRSLYRVIEPISGEVEIVRYEAVHDRRGRLIAYRAWARRM